MRRGDALRAPVASSPKASRRAFLCRSLRTSGWLGMVSAIAAFPPRARTASANDKNPFAYDVGKFERTDPKLVHYRETARFRSPRPEPRRLALGPVWGLTPLPACIAGVSPRLRYYRTRIGERMRSHGLLGLVPARFWALSQARRRSR